MNAVFTALLSADFLICGLYCSWSDIKTGLISNKVLIGFACFGLVIDLILYGWIRRDLLEVFLLSLAVMAVVSWLLYLSHLFAGGDCKLLLVFCLLYPAQFIFRFYGTLLSQPLCIAFAFLYGTAFITLQTLWVMIRKKKIISWKIIWTGMLGFLALYFKISLCVLLLQLGLSCVSLSIQSQSWFQWLQILCSIGISWMVCQYPHLQKKQVWIPVLLMDIVLCVITGQNPFLGKLDSYLLVLAVALLRIFLSQSVYQTIPASDISKGMILSASSSMLLQSSRIKNLPGISDETLRCRLSKEQAAAVRRWSKSAKGYNELTIMRKIPFAVFLFLGYLTYFLIWRSL